MTAEFFNQVTLDDTEAKGSYGIGLQIGQQLLDSQLAVKAEAVAKGIYDVLNQHAPALDFNEISQALQQLQQQAAEAQQAQFKEIEAAGKAFLEANKQKDGVKVTDSGLQYEVLVEGNGNVPSTTDKVRVHYTGTLPDGTVFDSSVARGQPAERRDQRLDRSAFHDAGRFQMAFGNPTRISLWRTWRRRSHPAI